MAKLSDEKQEFFRELSDCLELELNRAYRESPSDIKSRVEELRTLVTPLRGSLWNLHATIDDNPEVMPFNGEWQWLYLCHSRLDAVFDREMKAACATRESIEKFRGARIVSYVEFLDILAGKHFFALLKCSELNPLVPVPSKDGSCRNTIAAESIPRAVAACNELLKPFGIESKPSEPIQDRFIPNDIQRAILEALDGKALKVDQLAAVCQCERRRFYGKRQPLKELKEHGFVDHKHNVGYFRPDALPSGFVHKARTN